MHTRDTDDQRYISIKSIHNASHLVIIYIFQCKYRALFAILLFEVNVALKQTGEGAGGQGSLNLFGLKVLPLDQLPSAFGQLFPDNKHIF